MARRRGSVDENQEKRKLLLVSPIRQNDPAIEAFPAVHAKKKREVVSR